MLVATLALGGAMMQPGVNSVDDATGEYVGSADGQVALAIGAGIALGAVIGAVAHDRLSSGDVNTTALQKADALETKKAIYDQAALQKQNNENILTAYGNYLNDTESIALMEGKSAYIRALENGSAEAIARNAATEAVADYYATKQQNIIAAWNTSALLLKSSIHTAENTSGVSSNFVYAHMDSTDGAGYSGPTDANATLQHTLVNSSTRSVESIVHDHGNGFTFHATFAKKSGSEHESFDVGDYYVKPPNDNYAELVVTNPDTFNSRWTAIEAQNDEVQVQLDSFINNTYSQYQQGEINTSDLVDPYLGAREYSPETSNTWTLRTLTSVGVAPPENLSSVGRMNVTAGSQTYSGVLMSDGVPANSSGFTVGETYNASNITGAQFVALDDGGSHKLTGEFTLSSVDGRAAGETLEYRTINYQTADTQEFKALQEKLDKLTAEINAKQQQERNAGGGGLLPDFGQGGAIPGAVLLAAAAALLLTRN